MENSNNPLSFLKELREERILDKKGEIELQSLDTQLEINKENLAFTKELNKLRLEQVRSQIKAQSTSTPKHK